MSLGELAEWIESVDIDSSGVGELTSALHDLNRIDGWVSVTKASIARRLAELEASGQAPPATDMIARSNHTSRRAAAKAERRANAYGMAPELARQRAAGRISDEHADVLANSASKLDDRQRLELFAHGDDLARQLLPRLRRSSRNISAGSPTRSSSTTKPPTVPNGNVSSPR